MHDYITLARLERAVKHAATQRGLKNADPLADLSRRLGTPDQELIALDLYQDLPKQTRLLSKDLAHKLCRCAVLSHFLDDDPNTSERYDGSNPPTTHPAIERARSRALSNGNATRRRRA